MNKFDDNKATPTKRTGDERNPSEKDYVSDNDSGQSKSIEMPQPGSTSATPDIPTEMPARDNK